jgi:hypothetical protein
LKVALLVAYFIRISISVGSLATFTTVGCSSSLPFPYYLLKNKCIIDIIIKYEINKLTEIPINKQVIFRTHPKSGYNF